MFAFAMPANELFGVLPVDVEMRHGRTSLQVAVGGPCPFGWEPLRPTDRESSAPDYVTVQSGLLAAAQSHRSHVGHLVNTGPP
jgi:hypothetical protein